MTWNQIENKWAAMARRVRADWKGAMQDAASQPTAERESTIADTKLGIVLFADAKLQETNTASAE